MKTNKKVLVDELCCRWLVEKPGSELTARQSRPPVFTLSCSTSKLYSLSLAMLSNKPPFDASGVSVIDANSSKESATGMQSLDDGSYFEACMLGVSMSKSHAWTCC